MQIKELVFSKKLILFVLICIFFPPLPVLFNSVIFKIEGLLIGLLFFLNIPLIFKKNLFENINRFIIFLFVMPALWGLIIGLLNKNPEYYLLKDLFFFLIPLMVYVLLVVKKVKIGDLRDTIIVYAYYAAFFQIIFSVHGLITWNNRPFFRHTSLLISTEVVIFALILNISKDLKLFKLENVLFIMALLSTLGRFDLLFVIASICTVLFLKIVKNGKLRFVYLVGFFMAGTIFYFLPLFLNSVNIIGDSSVRWRYIEWLSYFNAIKDFSLSQILFGNGFGSFLKTIRPLRLFSGVRLFQIDRFHNLYLFLMFKLGFVGMIYVFSLIYYVFKGLRLYTENNFVYLKFLLVILILVGGLVGGINTSSLLMGIVLGLLIYIYEGLVNVKRYD